MLITSVILRPPSCAFSRVSLRLCLALGHLVALATYLGFAFCSAKPRFGVTASGIS
jgi:hypothetical protein